MALAVADTGPPHYLVLIGAIDLLPRLFQAVILPAAVQMELRHARAPVAVRDWINHSPPWLRVEATPPLSTLPFPRLDSGERAAIALAQSLGADVVLMDDRDGVTAALSCGLTPIGTLGVLDLAARRGFVDFASALARLKTTNFRVRPDLLDELLALHRRHPDWR